MAYPVKPVCARLWPLRNLRPGRTRCRIAIVDDSALRVVARDEQQPELPAAPNGWPLGLSGQSACTSNASAPGLRARQRACTSAAVASRTAAGRLRRNLPASAARRRNGKRQRGNPRRDGAAGEDSGGRRRDPEFSRGTARPGDGHDEGSQLSALGSRLSALGSRLSALGSRLSALGSRLSALGSRLSALTYSATLCPRLGPGTPCGPGVCARNRLRLRRRRSGPGARRKPA